MKLVQLEYFCAVCRYHSITRAAEELYVTQPTISVAIRELEKELKLRLFHHEKNRISITQEGEAFYRRAEAVLKETRAMVTEFSSMGEKETPIRIGIPPLIVPRHFEVAAYCKKTAKNFLYFTDDTYKSVLFTTACSFLFHQSNRLDKGGVRGCAKRRAAIDSAQDWTDQAKHLSSESFLLCIPLDALLTAVYSCLLTTKNGERTAPTTVRPLSIHQTNSMSAKKQVLL